MNIFLLRFSLLVALSGFSHMVRAQTGNAIAVSGSQAHNENTTSQAQSLPKLMVLQARVDVDKSQHIDPAALTNLVSKTAAEQKKYQVLSYADVAALLDNESQKQLLGCTETSCMAEVGQAMGAQFLLYAQVGQVGKTFLTTVNLLDVEKAQVTARESISVKRSENLIQASKVAAQRVFGHKVAFVEPKAEPLAQAKTNYLIPTKWGLAGAAGLFALAGIGATGLAYYSYNEIQQIEQGSVPTNLHIQQFAATAGEVIAFPIAGILALGSGMAFVADAVLDDEERADAQQNPTKSASETQTKPSKKTTIEE